VARKSIFVSALSGAEIQEGKGAQVTIKFLDAKALSPWTLPMRRASSWALRAGSRLVAEDGQRPLLASERAQRPINRVSNPGRLGCVLRHSS